MPHLLSDPELARLERAQMNGFRSELRRQLKHGANLNMVLMGDSIGASTFAGTIRGQSLRLNDGLKVLRALTLQYFVPDTSEEFIARLGEITGCGESHLLLDHCSAIIPSQALARSERAVKSAH